MDKLTSMEKKWVLYDVGNSAFILLVSTIIPIYFKNMATEAGISPANSTAYWGYAASAATIIIACIGPLLGAIADHKGFKKPLFSFFVLLGALGCCALSIPTYWLFFLGIFVAAKVGYSGSMIFYDSMLTDITTDERMDNISSMGYAWGYLGSCLPFILCLLLILLGGNLGISTLLATKLAFFITSFWWILMTLPLLKNYQQTHYIETTQHSLRNSVQNLGVTIKKIKADKKVFLFLIAFFFYIDGVYTIIEMATSYGKDVGISDNNLLLALLLTQLVAFPFAVLFGRLSKKYKTESLISFSILGYLAIAIFALQLDKAWEFWFLAVCVAVFQGAIQALSRSYFAKIIPKENSNEYFGFYDIFGKGAAFTGTLLMGIITQITGNSKYGVASICVLILFGYFLFIKATKK